MTSTCSIAEPSQSSGTLIVNLAASPSAPSPNSVDSTSAEACDNLPSLDRQVRHLLNELTTETFDPISDQIIEWANKSEEEKDGKTLSRVVHLVFERAIDNTASPEIYAQLCHKMVARVAKEVEEHEVQDVEGKPIVGDQLLKQLLLNSCQDFSGRIWMQREVTAAAFKAEDEKNKIREAGEVALYLGEYYAAQKAKQQSLGLVRFISELFKLQMLTESVIHEHLKKLLGNVKNPEEEDIEGLCTVLTKVGSTLDTLQAHARMDVYFQRITELASRPNVSFRLKSMLQDVIKLRGSKWMNAHARKEKKEKKRKIKKDEEERSKEEEEKDQEEDNFKQNEKEEHERSSRKGKGKGKGKGAKSEKIVMVDVEQAKDGGEPVGAPEKGDFEAQVRVPPGVGTNRTPKKLPSPLNLAKFRSPPTPPPFAVSTIRVIDDLEHISYPDGISGPKPELNANAREGKFRYDRDFLMQFRGICPYRPDMLPPLSAVGLASIDKASQALQGDSVARGHRTRR